MQSALTLPPHSVGPRGLLVPFRASTYRRIREAGFDGVQIDPPLFGLAPLARRAGLRFTVQGMVAKDGPLDVNLERFAARFAARGAACATLLVGTGTEPFDAACRLVERLLSASATHGLSLLLETHRATITNDPFTTLRLVEKFPELRFNGDFSHWYVCSAMGREGLDAHLDALGPVFARTRYLHGRVASTGCIQVQSDVPEHQRSLHHFERIWTAAFRHFLEHAAPDETIGFAPELLPPWQGYGQVHRQDDGKVSESGDRWAEALSLATVARRCFDAARTGTPPAASAPTPSITVQARDPDPWPPPAPDRPLTVPDRIRFELHLDTLLDEQGAERPIDPGALAAWLAASGYTAVQVDDEAPLNPLPTDMPCSLRARVVDSATLAARAHAWNDRGVSRVAVHLGRALDDDAAACRAVETFLTVAQGSRVPLLLALGRGTLTQDALRTLALLERFPDLRLDADFSEWMLAHELVLGAKRILAAWSPVHAHVSALTARIGTAECIQAELATPGFPPVAKNLRAASIKHIKSLWRASLAASTPPLPICIRLPPFITEHTRLRPGDPTVTAPGLRLSDAPALQRIALRCVPRA